MTPRYHRGRAKDHTWLHLDIEKSLSNRKEFLEIFNENYSSCQEAGLSRLMESFSINMANEDLIWVCHEIQKQRGKLPEIVGVLGKEDEKRILQFALNIDSKRDWTRQQKQLAINHILKIESQAVSLDDVAKNGLKQMKSMRLRFTTVLDNLQIHSMHWEKYFKIDVKEIENLANKDFSEQNQSGIFAIVDEAGRPVAGTIFERNVFSKGLKLSHEIPLYALMIFARCYLEEREVQKMFLRTRWDRFSAVTRAGMKLVLPPTGLPLSQGLLVNSVSFLRSKEKFNRRKKTVYSDGTVLNELHTTAVFEKDDRHIPFKTRDAYLKMIF